MEQRHDVDPLVDADLQHLWSYDNDGQPEQTYPEVLRHQIARTRGDLASQNLLAELANQFGQAIGVVRRRAAANLIDSCLVVGGRETTTITRSASDDPIGPDDGWFSGTSEFTYST